MGHGQLWIVECPPLEARYAVANPGPMYGEDGRRKPGRAWLDECGRLLLDTPALNTLVDRLPFTDYRVSRDGDGLRMEVGRDRWPVLPAPEGTKPPAE